MLARLTEASENRIRRATDALAERGLVIICVCPYSSKVMIEGEDDDEIVTAMPTYARCYFRTSDYHNVHTYEQYKWGKQPYRRWPR